MKAFAAAAAGLCGAAWYKSQNAAEAAFWSSEPSFSQKEFKPYKLVQVTQESHNVKRFRFALNSSSTELDLPIASCISLRYIDAKGEDVVRPYTPVDLSNQRGHFDLVVKCYPNSKMGSHLFSMKVGDSIDVKGPWPTLPIACNQFNQIGMIAGGTGITPMFQTITNVLHAPKNETSISLLFSNKTADDMLMSKDLDALSGEFPGKFAPHYVLSQPHATWAGHKGHIDKAMIQKYMPAATQEKVMIMVSGPPAFMKDISGPKDYSNYPPKQGSIGGYLKELGYSQSQVFKL